MIKYLLVLSLLLPCIFVFSQEVDSTLTKSKFDSEISKLTSRIKLLEKTNFALHQTNLAQNQEIDSINSQLFDAKSTIQQIADSLQRTTTNLSATNKQTQNQIQDINQTITNRTLYWIIGILGVALISVIVFFILRSKLSIYSQTLDSQIAKTNHVMQNEAIKLDSKLVEILQAQLSILSEERKIEETPVNNPDHNLPLKVGNEIYRMRQRIVFIGPEDRSMIPLRKSLDRLEDEFNKGGYEIIDMLNRQYNDGLSVKATFIPVDDLNSGERIITKVIKPQINFMQEAIQMAEIEVSTGN